MYYSSMSFQMIGTILAFVFIGWQLDKYFGNSKKIFTALLAIIGVAGSMYSFIRKLGK